MSTSEQSQPAARRRGELHRSNGDRQVGQVMGARRRLNVLPLRAGLDSVWRETAIKKRVGQKRRQTARAGMPTSVRG